MRKLIREVVGTFVVLAIFAFFGYLFLQVTAEAADTIQVEIPIDTIHRGSDGELFPLAEIPVEVGSECTAKATSNNNESTHPGTNIVIITNAPETDAAIFDIESASFMVGSVSFVTDGPIVAVFLQLGPDGVSSTGILLEVTCHPPTTTTTAAPPPTTTTPPAPTTTTLVPPVTTTTEPPPINGIDTGGGACAGGACDSRNGLMLAGLLAMLVSGLVIAGWKATYSDE